RINAHSAEERDRLGVRAEQALPEPKTPTGNTSATEIACTFEVVDRRHVRRRGELFAYSAHPEEMRRRSRVAHEACGHSLDPGVECLGPIVEAYHEQPTNHHREGPYDRAGGILLGPSRDEHIGELREAVPLPETQGQSCQLARGGVPERAALRQGV